MFLTNLVGHLHPDNETIWILDEPLEYFSTLLNTVVVVPKGFNTDFASVPRVPIIYTLWGDRAHREAVIHDYLYRIDCRPNVSVSEANDVFSEAMKERGKPWWVRWPMYWGVCLAGNSSYHKRNVDWRY